MLIITGKRKDCFDMFTHKYGVDPLLVFNRVECMKHNLRCNYKGDVSYTYNNLTESALAQISKLGRNISKNSKEETHLAFLSIFGSVYVVQVKKTYTKMHFPNDKFFNVEPAEVKRNVLDSDTVYQMAVLNNNVYQKDSLKSIAVNYGKVHKGLLSLHKELGLPWFIISDDSSQHRSSYIRTGNFLLSEIGLDRIFDPETIYQELSLFLGSMKNQNPPVELADIERCEKAGFDKKVSFRKRKSTT